MKIFSTFNEILSEGSTLSITVSKLNGSMSVSVLPGNSLVKDKAKEKFSPIVIKGTPEELDSGFITELRTPIERASGLLLEIADFERSEEEVLKNSQMAKKKAEKEKKIADEFTGYIALSKKNLENQKYKDALKCAETAYSKAVNDKQKKEALEMNVSIKEESGESGIFGAKEDKSDGKDVELK